MNFQQVIIYSLLYITQINPSYAARYVVCDRETEFLCRKDNKCIPNTSVCNFKNDCSDGQDESRCGTCNFRQSPSDCGLTFVSDKVLGWYWKGPTDSDDVIDKNPLTAPIYYMALELNSTMKQYIGRHRNNNVLSHKPKVFFPHLRPTNNKKCKFIFQLRLTEKGPHVEGSMLRASWPNVTMFAVQSTVKDNESELSLGQNNRHYQAYDLQLEKRNAGKRARWQTYEIEIGVRQTVWTLELLIQSRIRGYLVHVSNFKFQNCESVDSDTIEDVPNLVPLDLNITCGQHQFRCRQSNLCINTSLVCDFGYDCGYDDTSDEDLCDEYPGRCDFEDDSLCDWYASPSTDYWRWMSAYSEDQIFYEKLPRPKTDHTLRSTTEGGHYMLLNTPKLKTSTMYRFLGPKVYLRDGAKDCNFRFWINTPLSLDQVSAGISSPYLTVGYEHIPSKRLFSHQGERNDTTDEVFSNETNNMNWIRREIRLLDSYNIDERSISILEVSFGNFGDDLQLFLDNGGFIALDDFSFTPGCGLTFTGPILEESCGDGHFYCSVPTPFTFANCIPLENYCDFKNDCGLLKHSDLLASDEHDCPHQCDFTDSDNCAHDIIDSYSLKRTGELKENDKSIEAFCWTSIYKHHNATIEDYTPEQHGHIKIHGQAEKYKKQLESLTNSAQNDDSLQQGYTNLKNLLIELPTFTESHGNCTFELTYEWSIDANNLVAFIKLNSERSINESLLKQIEIDDVNPGRKSVRFGIGQQNYPFKLIIEISFKSKTSTLNYNGSIVIYSYRFSSCSFIAGLIDSSQEIEFRELDDDEDDIGCNDYLEYPYMPEKDSSKPELECEKGFFQCRVPITCIPKDLVCDLQRDCQGGLDERYCDSYHRYTFDDEISHDWLIVLNSSLEWHEINGNSHYRKSLDTGPPYDHSRSDEEGKYLMMSSLIDKSPFVSYHKQPQVASIYSPRFRLNQSCRVVFYVYLWGRNVDKFQVLKHTYQPEESIDPLFELDGQEADQIDAWQRVSLMLKPNKDDEEFALIFRGFGGIVYSLRAPHSDIIAIDDVSFDPACQKSMNQTRLVTPFRLLNGSVEEQKSVSESESSGPITTVVIALCLLLTGLVIAIIFVRGGNLRRLAFSAMDQSNSRQVGTVVCYTLDDLADGRVALVQADTMQL